MSVQFPSSVHSHELGQASLTLPLPHPHAWMGTTQALGFSRRVFDYELDLSDTPLGLKSSGFSFRFHLNELRGN
jgi:hypothetical protein